MATPGNLGSSVLASKTKTKKKHFVAQKVKLFRASDPLLSVLMWGVNHSVRARAAAAVSFLLLLLFLLAPSYCSCCQAWSSSGALALRVLALRSCPPAAAPRRPHPRAHARSTRPPARPGDLPWTWVRMQDGGIPSASELCGRYRCHPGPVSAAWDLGSLCGRGSRGCQPRRGCWGRGPGCRALLRSAAGTRGAPPAAGVPVRGWSVRSLPAGRRGENTGDRGIWTAALVLTSFPPSPLETILLELSTFF